MPSFLLFLFMYVMSFLFVMCSDDWFLVWLGLELNMMSYIVMIYQQYNMNVVESCLKYFFIQSLGSAVFLSLFYLNESGLSSLMIFVFSYKIGAGPFFFWFPSICSGLDWMSCYVLMTFQKVLPLMMMSLFKSWVIWYIAMFSLVFGVFGSFNQSNIKQLMAYSSVHHLGWILLCLMVDDMVWLIYLFIYMVILMSVVYALLYNEIVDLMMVSKWSGKWWFVFGILSMGGMPPLLGFFLSWMAFIYIVKMSFLWVLFLIIMSVVMFYVYLRVVYDVIMGYKLMVSWSNDVCKDFFKNQVDFLSIFGFIFGLVLGLLLMY